MKKLFTFVFMLSLGILNAQESSDTTNSKSDEKVDDKLGDLVEFTEYPSFAFGNDSLKNYLAHHSAGIKPKPEYINEKIVIKVFFVIEKDGSISEVTIPKKYCLKMEKERFLKICPHGIQQN